MPRTIFMKISEKIVKTRKGRLLYSENTAKFSIYRAGPRGSAFSNLGLLFCGTQLTSEIMSKVLILLKKNLPGFILPKKIKRIEKEPLVSGVYVTLRVE